MGIFSKGGPQREAPEYGEYENRDKTPIDENSLQGGVSRNTPGASSGSRSKGGKGPER